MFGTVTFEMWNLSRRRVKLTNAQLIKLKSSAKK